MHCFSFIDVIKPICNTISSSSGTYAAVSTYAAPQQNEKNMRDEISGTWTAMNESMIRKTENRPAIDPLRANQTLHQWINSAPIHSLVLRTPRFTNTTKFGIVLLVITATNERTRRDEIRRTWASLQQSKMQQFGSSIVIFLVGRNSELDEEAAEYSDLLQVDIEDTYRNLVYKVEAGFRWLNASLQSEFVAKIDSDTVVHIDRLYRRLQKFETERGTKDWIECGTNSNYSPVRDNRSQWYVPKEDYPLETYPTYCNGNGYVMKRKTFKNMVVRMSEHKIIEPEDVFYTGIIAKDFAHLYNEGVAVNPYTEFSSCDSDGPILSILSTDRYGANKMNITVAWGRLKSPFCLRISENRR